MFCGPSSNSTLSNGAEAGPDEHAVIVDTRVLFGDVVDTVGHDSAHPKNSSPTSSAVAKDGEELDHDTLVDHYLGGAHPLPGLRAPGRDFRYRPAVDFDTGTMRADLEHDLAVLEQRARAAAAAVADDPQPGVITGLSQLKGFRGLATRYDKTADSYAAAVCPASFTLWARSV